MKVSLFIPIYNVGELLTKIIRESYNALQELHDDFEIFIVDDNSTDKPYRFKGIIDKIQTSRDKSLKYLAYEKGPSRRENLAKSFGLARHDIICFIDADFSCDISFLLKAINLFEKNVDIVVGSRYIKGSKVKRRIARRAFSFFYNMTLRSLFKSEISDHQCGLKVFRKSKAMPIIDKMGYDDKFIRGWFWDAEFLIRSQKAKLKIIEMAVEWTYADSSTFNILRELKCLRAIAKLKKGL